MPRLARAHAYLITRIFFFRHAAPVSSPHLAPPLVMNRPAPAMPTTSVEAYERKGETHARRLFAFLAIAANDFARLIHAKATPAL
jgi:hypothetical protein